MSDHDSNPPPWGSAYERVSSYASSARTYWVTRPTLAQRIAATVGGVIILGLLVIVLAAALVVGSVFALVFFLAMGVQRLINLVAGRVPNRTSALRRNVRVIPRDDPL